MGAGEQYQADRDTYQSRNGYSDKVVAIDVGNSCYLHASHASDVYKRQGLLWIATGFALTVVPVLIMGIVTFKWLKIDFGTMAGMLCGDVYKRQLLRSRCTILPSSTRVSRK